MNNEFELVRLLAEKKLHICCAESCTGGLLSAAIVNVPDASAVLTEGFVTYSDEAKIKYLGVDARTIVEFGVVSSQVAAEMASGAAEASGAEVGVGITGYAGPSGGDSFAPVGTVCFGFFISGKTITRVCRWPELSRNDLRAAAVDFALDTLCQLLQNA